MEMRKRMVVRSRANQNLVLGRLDGSFGCVAGVGRDPGAGGVVDEISTSCISIDEGRLEGRA